MHSLAYLGSLLLSAACIAASRETLFHKTDFSVATNPKQEYSEREVTLSSESNTAALELCECEPAEGSPNGLSCDKEGFFISNFQQAGQWLNGGGLVPLSKALCCRACLPTELPGELSNSSVAIISYGCHPSSNSGPASILCEATGGSFVTGWSEAVRVPNSAEFYYPVGPVDCCTPSVLLSNGKVQELERCQCTQENDINCGGQSSNRLLTGYLHSGTSQQGLVVPIAPALCCKMCIPDATFPAESCSDLNHCSGHGVCNLGACECNAGFGSADCSQKSGGQASAFPHWLVAVIVLSSLATFCIFIFVTLKLIQHFAQTPSAGEEGGSEEGELREPLIMGLASDDEGSVGSSDSSDCEGDEDAANMPPPIRRQAAGDQADEAVGGGVLVQPQEGQTPPPTRTEPFEISHEGGEPGEGHQPPLDLTAALLRADAAATESIRRYQAAQQQRAEVASGSEERRGALGDDAVGEELKEAADKQTVKAERPPGGIPGIECSICLNRPVQVAVVPCGHMCMCRRCSRRLLTCPVCRCRIIRRQRIFVGG